MTEKKAKKVVVNGGSILVQHGVNAIKLTPNYAGKSLNQILDLTRTTLNLPDSVAVIVNGNIVDNLDTTKVKKGDEVEFIKAAGTKG